MVTRRAVVGSVVAAAGLSGCLDFATGEEPLEVTAEPARGSEAAAEETGYELASLESESVSEEFEGPGGTREVRATNWIATHEKTIDYPIVGSAELGVFAVIATPSVEVVGREFNPVGEYDNDALVDLVADEYDDLDVDDDATETVEREALGESFEVSVYEGDASFDGAEFDVYVHVGSFRTGDDYLVPVGVYPQDLDGERENVERMTESLRHPVELPE